MARFIEFPNTEGKICPARLRSGVARRFDSVSFGWFILLQRWRIGLAIEHNDFSYLARVVDSCDDQTLVRTYGPRIKPYINMYRGLAGILQAYIEAEGFSNNYFADSLCVAASDFAAVDGGDLIRREVQLLQLEAAINGISAVVEQCIRFHGLSVEPAPHIRLVP